MENKNYFDELTKEVNKLLEIKALCLNNKIIFKENEKIVYLLDRILEIIKK